jgi:hypothetical protein
MGVGVYATPLTIRFLRSDVSLRSVFNCHNTFLLKLFTKHEDTYCYIVQSPVRMKNYFQIPKKSFLQNESVG